MLTATVEVNLKPEVLVESIRRKLAQRMGVVANDLKERIQQDLSISNQHGMYPAYPGEAPHRGNGDLIRSMYSEQAGPLEWHVGTRGVPYGLLQEIGGIIRSVNWMWVPVSKEAVAHRSKKGTVTEFVTGRDMHFVHRSGMDYALAVERNGDKETIHYVLKHEVFVPAHPYLRPAAHDPAWRRRAMELLGEPAEGISTRMDAETKYAGHVEQWIGHQ